MPSWQTIRLLERSRIRCAGRLGAVDFGGAGVREVGRAAEIVIETLRGIDLNVARAAGGGVGGVAGQLFQRGVACAAGIHADVVGRSGQRGAAGARFFHFQLAGFDVALGVRCATEGKCEGAGLLVDAVECAFGCAGKVERLELGGDDFGFDMDIAVGAGLGRQVKRAVAGFDFEVLPDVVIGGDDDRSFVALRYIDRERSAGFDLLEIRNGNVFGDKLPGSDDAREIASAHEKHQKHRNVSHLSPFVL